MVLYCVVINGLRGMPGWALGNIAIGLCIGLAFRAAKKTESPALRTILSIAAIIIGTGIGILGIKSITESILYGQPFMVRAGKNIYAFTADVVVLIASLPVCIVLDKTARKMFPGQIR